jgi:hypothetical protein
MIKQACALTQGAKSNHISFSLKEEKESFKLLQ